MAVLVSPAQPKHVDAIRSFLGRDAISNMYLLGLLEEYGLHSVDDAEMQFLTRFEDGAPTAVVFVGGEGELVIPSAAPASHIAHIAASLPTPLALQSCLGESELVEALIKQSGATVQFVKEQVLYAVSADDLGPFTNPALRLAVEKDTDALVELAAGAVEELMQVDPLDLDAAHFAKRVQHRIRSKRTYVLEVDGRCIFKLDIGPRSRFGAELEGIYTLPEYRGKGHATLCLGQISRFLMSSLPRLTVRVDAESSHFGRIARRVGYLPGRTQRMVSCIPA